MKPGTVASQSTGLIPIKEEAMGKKDFRLSSKDREQAANQTLESRILKCASFITDIKPPIKELDVENARLAFKVAVIGYVREIKEAFNDALKMVRINATKNAIETIINNLTIDNGRLFDLLNCFRCYNLFGFSYELQPLIDMLHLFMAELIRKNAFEKIYLDTLSVQLAELYIELATEENYLQNTQSARIYFERVVVLLRSISPDYKSIQRNVANLSLVQAQLIDIDLKEGHLALACNTLRKFKKQGVSDEYYINCISAYKAFAAKEDFANAYIWLEEGFPYYHSKHFDLALEVQKIILTADQRQAFIHDRKQELVRFKKLHYTQLSKFLDDYRSEITRQVEFNFTIDQLVIGTNIQILWTDHQKNTLLSMVNAKNVVFLSHAIVLNSISKIPVFAVSKVLGYIDDLEVFLELESKKEEQKTSDVPQVQAIITEQIVTSSVDCAPASDKGRIVLHDIDTQSESPKAEEVSSKLAKKLAKAQRALEAQKIKEEAEPILQQGSDATLLGFDEVLFGQNKFYQCRMRGMGRRPIYVVYAGNQSHVQPPEEVITEFVDNRFPNAKIVPPKSESGFKWSSDKKGKQPDGQSCPWFLVGKSVTKGWRLYPTDVQTNAKGEMAFRYGEFHYTKTGKWDKKVRIHGAPKLIKHR